MKKVLSALACSVLAASVIPTVPVSAASAAPDVDANWQYKTLVDFEELMSGFQFGGKEDVGYTLYLNDAVKFGARVGEGGYKGSNTFEIYANGDKSVYAQPLINVAGFSEKNTEFEGATEFWMWVDFTNITFDDVGVQFRIIEGDYAKDGTPIADKLSQWAPQAGKPVYIQSSPTTWKTITIGEDDTKDAKLPTEQLVGYKGFIRIPISSFYAHDAGYEENGKFDLLNVSQVWFIFNFPNNNDKEYFAVDQLMFVGPSLNDGKAISKIQLTDTNQKEAGGETSVPTTPAITTPPSNSETSTSADTTAETSGSVTDTITQGTQDTSAIATTAGGEPGSVNLLWIWIALGVLAVGGAGAVVWLFVIKKKKS